MFVQISRKTQFTIHTTDAGYATFSIDHIHFYLWRHDLVHGEHITHIGVARVGPSPAWRQVQCDYSNSCSSCLYRQCPLLSKLRYVSPAARSTLWYCNDN